MPDHRSGASAYGLSDLCRRCAPKPVYGRRRGTPKLPADTTRTSAALHCPVEVEINQLGHRGNGARRAQILSSVINSRKEQLVRLTVKLRRAAEVEQPGSMTLSLASHMARLHMTSGGTRPNQHVHAINTTLLSIALRRCDCC